jgi:hypothetical protein
MWILVTLVALNLAIYRTGFSSSVQQIHTDFVASGCSQESSASSLQELKDSVGRSLSTRVKLASTNDCVNNGCIEDRTEWAYHCQKWNALGGGECGNSWNFGDDDFRKKRATTYYRCPKPGGFVWRVLCGSWQDAGCCTNGVLGGPPVACQGTSGEPQCGSNGQPGV